MFDQMHMQSPLSGVLDGGIPNVELHNVVLTELVLLGHFNLRFQPDNEKIQRNIRRMLGFEVPHEPNTFLVHREILCAWLGPDEWLVVAPQHRILDTEQTLTEIASDNFATCVSLSAAQTIIRTSGPKSVDLLSRGVAFDLHPSRFEPGQCVQTMLARTAVTILNQATEEVTLDVIVRRSFADYLWRWLVDAGREFEFTA